MAIAKKTRHQAEFGDFQTPIALAREVCHVLSRLGLKPYSVLEPTCGMGSFLIASLESFSTAGKIVGIEINENYVQDARAAVKEKENTVSVEITRQDFFEVHWKEVLESLPDPLLVIGNPPWVTNAELGALGSSNLPEKSNFQNYRGIEVITGKGNFDISEWMLIKSLEWISGRQATMAMLCKTAVARKALFHAWKFGYKLKRSDIYLIDAVKYFGVMVEACLLVVEASLEDTNFDCRVHMGLDEDQADHAFGLRNKQLVADVEAYDRWKHLEGREWYKWRSGIKHDCAKVMEFRQHGKFYRNGLGETVDLEDDYLYPMLKSADVANGPTPLPSRWMLVTQQSMGEDTSVIRQKAPKTWRYLKQHADLLDRRASSIYRKRPRFSVFGVGDYSFALWKVAISGLYKKLDFRVVGPYEGKPVVFDDTCYFVSCQTKEEAELLASLLNCDIAKEFFSAIIFWDAKRPITAAILRRLDLLAVARQLNLERILKQYLKQSILDSSDRSQYAFDFAI